MANLPKNDATNHSEHWKLTIDASHASTPIELQTAGKYVDRNIDVYVPQAAETVAGTAAVTVGSVSAGTKADGKYPITATVTVSGTAKATVGTKGFTDSTEYSGSITKGTVTNNATLTAAAASVALSGSATKPTIAKNAATNASSGSITTTKPGSGYYVAVQGTAPETTGTLTPSVTTAGYLGAASEISTSGKISASTGNIYYVPLTGSSLGNTAKTGVTYAENTSVTIPSKGALYIEGGYIGPTMITLDQMLDGKADTAGTAANSILDGHVAWSEDGEKLTGTMPNNGALGGVIEEQNGSYTIPAGYTEGGTVTATLPEMTLPTAAATTGSGTLKATISRSTSDQYINIPTGYNDTAAQYKISKTPNAGAATTKPTAVTTEVTVGTAASGYYPLTNTIGATSSHSSAGWATTTASTGTDTIQVGKIAQSTMKNGTTTVSSGYTIPAGNTVTISAGYYSSARTLTAQAKAASEGITGTLTASEITTGYTAPTLINESAKVTGKPYLTISGNGTMTSGNIYSGTATAKVQYLEVYDGSYT